MKSWWQSFGAGYTARPLLVCRDDDVIGIAPLKIKDGVASFIGDNSVCDYLDFITTPDMEGIFASTLLDYLKTQGVKRLLLETLRPDSIATVNVAHESQRRGWKVDFSSVDTSSEMQLPSDWNAYLSMLEARYRRDAERKMRQLENVAPVRFEVLRDFEVEEVDLTTFFHMMAGSRRDKASFLTDDMKDYFRRLTSAMASYGLLRLAFMYVGVACVAGILYFDYQDRIYLYNSGYTQQYAGMNAGLVSKLCAIRQAVSDGKKTFDFLKGSEIYKSRLGGHEVKLSCCDIIINPD
jgi:CelD/BcsL family acetyltransferase involved in cellulose biosynthesis